jgi:DNA-binding MarR family transcriptional regulator
MVIKNISESNFELWLSFGKAHHSVELARQKELNQYGIPHRQTHVLRTIKDLGTNATLAEIAKVVDRKPHVISSQTISMEKDGLIKRIRTTPKSSLLRIELTEKGLQMIKSASKSKSFDEIFSFLTEIERQQLKANFERMAINAEKYLSD